MERQDNIYVINDAVRQAIIAIINKAIHPAISFDQVNAIRSHLEDLRPVKVMEDLPGSGSDQEVIER